MSKNSRLVYSTAEGRIKAEKNQIPVDSSIDSGDGIVRIRRESKGRGGKVVCVIEGVPSDQVKAISKLLKQCCACGGATKAGLIEIQGDHRDKIKNTLEQQGFEVRFAGG